MIRASLIVIVAAGVSASAQDWTNSGGNAQRNGLTSEVGPASADLLWSGGAPSVIAWQPVIAGDRVVVVRQATFISGAPNDAPVVCYDLDTGAELWRTDLPFDSGDWTTWVGGVSQGKVYAARSGNGASVSDVVYALDITDGSIMWTSEAEVTAGFYDGMVFAPNGDPIVGDFRNLTRIDHTDGTTVWRSPRSCSVSSSCGGAVFGDRVYVADAAVGGHTIIAFDMATGAELYESPLMPGFTLQQTPMVGPEGTIYLARTQNNAAVDFFYAFEDTGAAINELWNVACAWVTSSEFTADETSVFYLDTDNSIVRASRVGGSEIDRTMPLAFSGSPSPRLALDGAGNLFASNGGFGDGRVYAFDADLDELWSVPVTNINIGGPAFGRDGTMIISGIGSDLRAYRAPVCVADFDGDGSVNVLDVVAFINTWQSSGPGSDFNGDGNTNILDVVDFISDWAQGCP